MESGKPDDKLSRLVDVFIVVVIVLSTIAVILESVEVIHLQWHNVFKVFELFCVIIFSVEYLARLWSCTTEKEFASPLMGRMRFAIKPLPVIDLMAILPSLMLVVGFDLRFLRLLRIFRIFRLASLTRYSASLRLLANVIKRSSSELLITLFTICILLILSSCMMYFAEHNAQPEKFSDIPTTMWWSVITITTVGYGDAYPVTVAGKMLTAVIALLGVGVLALPTAIIGSAFVEELTAIRKAKKCPHCGSEII